MGTWMRVVAVAAALAGLVCFTGTTSVPSGPQARRSKRAGEIRVVPCAGALPESACSPLPERVSAVDALVRQAAAAWEAGNFSRALEDSDRAVKLDPTDEGAKTLREKVGLALGEEGSVCRIKDWYERDGAALMERARAQEVEAEGRYERGVAWVQARRYADAIGEFTAVLKYTGTRLSLEMRSLGDRAWSGLGAARALKQAEEAERAGEEEGDRRARQLYQQAQVAVDKGQIDLAEALCDQVLEMDASAFDRGEAHALFVAARGDAEARELASLQLRAMARSGSQPDGLPQDTWVDIRRHGPHLGMRQEDERHVEVAREVKAKMRSTVINVDFRDTPLPHVVTYLREVSRLNILIDEAAIPNAESVRVTLSCHELFERVFACVLARCGLHSCVDQGCVIITAREPDPESHRR